MLPWLFAAGDSVPLHPLGYRRNEGGGMYTVAQVIIGCAEKADIRCERCSAVWTPIRAVRNSPESRHRHGRSEIEIQGAVAV